MSTEYNNTDRALAALRTLKDFSTESGQNAEYANIVADFRGTPEEDVVRDYTDFTLIAPPVMELDGADVCFLQVAGDLIANLFHLADRVGVEPEWVVERAWDHYTAEVGGEE